jgi:hypothetical protein
MAKDKKRKVPKRIAGVKVPKNLRKTANQALELAENPAARQLAIAALTAAAAALGERKMETVSQPEESDRENRRDDRTGRLSDVIIAAALDGARRLLDGIEAPAQTPHKARTEKGESASGEPAAAQAQ